MKFQIIVVIFCFLSLVSSYKTCSTNLDCPYGTCNDGFCSCSLSCEDFNSSKKHCFSFRRKPMSLCHAVNEACMHDKKIQIAPIEKLKNKNRFVRKYNCRSLDYNYGKVLCTDQSICNHNGVCVEMLTNGNIIPHCVCSNSYSGRRCDQFIFSASHAEVPPSFNPGLFVIIFTISTIALVVLFIFKKLRSKHHDLDLDRVISEQILTTTDHKIIDSRVDALKEKFPLFKK